MLIMLITCFDSSVVAHWIYFGHSKEFFEGLSMLIPQHINTHQLGTLLVHFITPNTWPPNFLTGITIVG